MLLHRFRKKATSGVAAEVCVEAEFLAFDQDTLTLEEKVTRYFEQWRGLVHRYVVAAFGNPAEAEDLTHEVFLQVLRTIGAFRGESQFTTWLYRLTVNQVLMHFRRASTRREALRVDCESDLVSNIATFASTSTPIVDRIGLKTAVASLPAGCRSVFLLFDVEGYKHEQIADIFGCSVGNSKSQLHKARKKLRHILRATS